MRLPHPRAVRRQFWLLVLAGLTREEAGAAVGIGGRTGHDWFHQAGGVAPSHVHAHPRGRYLSLAEREEIFAGVQGGQSIRAIAETIGRSPSTVLRELRRNMRHQYRTRPGSARTPSPAGPGSWPGTTDPAWLRNVLTRWPPAPRRPSWRPSSACMMRYRPNSPRN